MPANPWPEDADGLVALQDQLRRRAAEILRADPFKLPDAALIGGCFIAFARGEAGPGQPGDRAFAAAVIWEPGHVGLFRRGRGGVPARSQGKALRGTIRSEPRQAADVVEQAVVEQAVGSAYLPGLLALREGPALAAAVAVLQRAPDVLLVDASGADHPRRAGLALHLGWALDLPTVGITRRALRASGSPPLLVRGQWTPLTLDGQVVAASVCTRTAAQPVIAHAGWRTTVETAVAISLAASTEGARAPVPLQEARRVAREARDLSTVLLRPHKHGHEGGPADI